MKVSEPAKAVMIADTIDWRGTLQKVSPENGLSIESWNYNSSQFFQLNSTGTRQTPLSLYVFYLLTPGSLHLVKKSLDKRKNAEQHSSNTFFAMGNTPITFEVKTENPFRALVIKADIDWLYKELQAPEISSERLTGRLKVSRSAYGNYTPNEYILANKLYDHIAAGSADKMFILSRVFLLLSDFIERSFANSNTIVSKVPAEYYNKMLQVENIIISSIKQKLPSLAEIADKTAMSESGLKRYFRKVFGNNIHEYYMAAKMDAAKRMLVEKKFTVAEVSELLGYENTKHFIINFKKYFSYLPGHVLKIN